MKRTCKDCGKTFEGFSLPNDCIMGKCCAPPKPVPAGDVKVESVDFVGGRFNLREKEVGIDAAGKKWARTRKTGSNVQEVAHSDMIGDGLRKHFMTHKFPWSDWVPVD